MAPHCPATHHNHRKAHGHNGFGTTLLMPPCPGGVLFLPPGLEIWCFTTWSTRYYKTCLKATGLVVLVVYPQSTLPATGHLPCLVGDQVVVRNATWCLGGEPSGKRTKPLVAPDEGGNHWNRRPSSYISGSVFNRRLPKNKIHFTRFPRLPLDTKVCETISMSSVKLFDAFSRSLIARTRGTLSQLV